jgi:hypothetical protein
MNVLVACEFSGVVRSAFRSAGHDAYSCDLLEAEDGSPWHIRGDVVQVLGDGWDLLIAHPPCTYLANSGVRWLYKGGRGNMPDVDRWQAMRAAAAFFNRLRGSPIPRVAVENPIMHRHARQLIGMADQTVQPWMFGHGETKATCLWLRKLPPLEPTDVVEGRRPRVHHASPSPDRWKERSRTLPGLAAAMVAQWGKLR